MANIAQLVNVLQSVILTEGEKMVLTPTYHVFDLYKHHHDATLLNSHLETEGVYDGVPTSRFPPRKTKTASCISRSRTFPPTPRTRSIVR